MKAINPNEIKDNFIELIGKEWMLVSAGDKEKFNMMTASWGGVGVLWNRPVVFAFIFVKNLDIPLILSGLLGIYLVLCAYSAIGLFMSTLTSYQIVAAVGTLVILTCLNFVGGLWQDIPVVQEITWQIFSALSRSDNPGYNSSRYLYPA